MPLDTLVLICENTNFLKIGKTFSARVNPAVIAFSNRQKETSSKQLATVLGDLLTTLSVELLDLDDAVSVCS